MKLLMENTEDAKLTYIYGLVTIAFVALVLVGLGSLFGSQTFVFYVLISSQLALNELVSARTLGLGKIWYFILQKVLCYPIFIAMYVQIGNFALIEMWLASLILANIIAILILVSADKKSVKLNMNIFPKWLNFIKVALLPTITTGVGLAVSNLVIILIYNLYGDREVGVWANVYRILASPAFYLISISQYTVLAKVARSDNIDSAVLYVTRYWLRLVAFFCLSYCLCLILATSLDRMFELNWGSFYPVAFGVVCYGLLRSQSQYLETTFHYLGRSKFLIALLVLEVVAVTITSALSCCIPSQFYLWVGCFSLLFLVAGSTVLVFICFQISSVALTVREGYSQSNPDLFFFCSRLLRGVRP